jgi:hypothetical protein
MPKVAAAKRGAGKVEKRRGKKGKLSKTPTTWLKLLTWCKDPNAPKRGLSAYMFFANEQRENVREENPGISFGQVGKLLGERWKALNDKQRTPYEAKAAADKKRYEDEKAAYNVSTSFHSILKDQNKNRSWHWNRAKCIILSNEGPGGHLLELSDAEWQGLRNEAMMRVASLLSLDICLHQAAWNGASIYFPL